MTTKRLETLKKMETAKYDAALAIREILEAARKEAKAAGLDPDEVENEIIELVTTEDE